MEPVFLTRNKQKEISMKPQWQMAAAVWLASAALACSSGPKRVNYSATTSPNEVIETMDADVQDGFDKQVDVLARDDFRQAQKYLADAKEQIKDGKSQERVLRTLGSARAYLDRSKELAAGRRGSLEGVLTARKAALDAGARKFGPLRTRLGQIDDDVRDVAAEKSIGPKEFSNLQSRYFDLELNAIQSTHLDVARTRVMGSIDKNARKFTPKTLNRAELDLRNAENMISSHRHEETAFKPAVDRANASSLLLVDVGQKVRAGSAVLPENVALRLVYQERGLSNMSQRLQSLESQSEKSSEMLSAQDQELKRARETQALEQALAQARKQFNRDEADVYRDGSKLLIRLKSMNFTTGRADLPAESIPLLGKVQAVTEDLDPMQVVIEGHTDSTGSAKVNDLLSQKRAEAVAHYLENNGLDADKIQAIGYGFKKPIANNKSKAGRAQNRRVDVIVTPGAVETSTTSM